MKKMIVLLCAAFAFTGCKTAPVQSAIDAAKCKVEATVVTNVSSALVSTLACTNAAQVQADIQALVSKQNLCTAKVSKPKAGKKATAIGAIVCAPFAGIVTSYVQGKIPASWGCSGGAALPNLKQQLTVACERNL